MSPPSTLMELIGKLAFEAARLRPFLPTYLHLLASAIFPIYIGAHASLSIPSSAAPPAKRKSGTQNDDFADEEPETVAEKIEGLTPKDAILFPLLAGFTLSSLYFIIKWLEDPSTLNKILSYYFMQVGLVFGTKFLKDSFTIIRSLCLPSQYEQGGEVWKVNRLKQRYDAVNIEAGKEQKYRTSPFAGQLSRLPVPTLLTDRTWRIRALLYAKCSLNFHVHKLVTLKLPVELLDALAIITSLAVVGVFTFIYKPWYMSNLLGFAFCYGSTQLMSPTTFWTGTLLLSALFFYDIYFVFFTPMMVTVAMKLDIPIKLLFPRPSTPAETEKGVSGLAMLGLGDIVIPGMMLALALRFDLYLYYLKKAKTVDGKTEKAAYLLATGGWGERFWVGQSSFGPDLQARVFPKTYFRNGLLGYASGMIVTLLVMQIAEHAQPALLYLVPGVLIALWGTAALNGDLKLMWAYTEEKEDEKEDDSSKRGKGKEVEEAKTQDQKGKAINNDQSGKSKDTKVQQPGESMELPSISTAEEVANRTPSSMGDSETSSESPSDSGSNSDTPSSSQSEHPKHKEANSSKKKEPTDRHLIWFSIDFPPPAPPVEQPETLAPDTNPRHSRSSSYTATAQAQRPKKETGKPKNGVVSPMSSEPPEKRRRVK